MMKERKHYEAPKIQTFQPEEDLLASDDLFLPDQFDDRYGKQF